MRRKHALLSLQKGWFDPEEDEENFVTREDLNRDMLGMEPKVKRKRKNGKGEGYRPLDNRDHLPFSVRTKTPDDPYKNEYLKQKENQARIKKNKVLGKTTDLDRHMLGLSKGSSVKKKKMNQKRTKSENNADDESKTPSKLIQRRLSKKSKKSEGVSETTVLGEFELDKSTTSGDIIMLGEKEYLVESARCQYKYAGGQRFVMVRKILEVKEVTRVRKEEELMRRYKSSPSSLSSSALDEFE